MPSTTRDAVEILYRDLVGDDPAMKRLLAQAAAAHDIGQAAHDARVAAGLTQEQLAARVGVAADDIDAVEMGDFEEVPLALLERIAAALDKRLVVQMRFADAPPTRRTA